MITEERIEEIVLQVLELRAGKDVITLNDMLGYDLRIHDIEYAEIAWDIEAAFLERENCGIDLPYIQWITVEDICISVAEGLIEEGYTVIKKEEIEEM